MANKKSLMIKKRLYFFLMAMFFIFFSSCDVKHNMPFNQSKNITSFFPLTATVAESPTRVLFMDGPMIRYYNLLTKEIDIFCFDPLCDHRGLEECIAYKFPMICFLQNFRYCSYNNRFYVLRGEQLYSFAFDGSDLREECSFGEEGKIEKDPGHGFYNYTLLRNLTVMNENICFISRDEKEARTVVICYNAKNKTVKKIFNDVQTNVEVIFATEKGLYLSLLGDYSGLYRMNYDGTGLTQIINDFSIRLDDGIYDGKYLYMTEEVKQIEKDTFLYDIVAYSLETGKKQVLAESVGMNVILRAVTHEYIYYTQRDRIYMGSTIQGTEIFNYNSKIYRLNIKTGEVTVVLDDPHYETSGTLFFVEDTAIISGVFCATNEGYVERINCIYTAKIDEKGMFTDILILD